MNDDDDDDDGAKTEIGIRMLCSILGFSPEDLKTKIDIYSRDSSGKKTIIEKKYRISVSFDGQNFFWVVYDGYSKRLIMSPTKEDLKGTKVNYCPQRSQ